MQAAPARAPPRHPRRHQRAGGAQRHAQGGHRPGRPRHALREMMDAYEAARRFPTRCSATSATTTCTSTCSPAPSTSCAEAKRVLRRTSPAGHRCRRHRERRARHRQAQAPPARLDGGPSDVLDQNSAPSSAHLDPGRHPGSRQHPAPARDCKIGSTSGALERVSERGSSTDQSSGDLVPLEEERAVVAGLQRGDRSAFATLYGWYGELIYRQAILPRLPDSRARRRLPARHVPNRAREDRLLSTREPLHLLLAAPHRRQQGHRHPSPAQARPAASPRRCVEEPEAPSDSHPAPPRPRAGDGGHPKAQVDAALDNINARYAKALRLRLIEERSREECAELLGVTVGNFDVILHRATKAFRKVYEP